MNIRFSAINHWKYFLYKQVMVLFLTVFSTVFLNATEQVGKRVNQLGYTPSQKKVAVLVAKKPVQMTTFSVKEKNTGKEVFKGEFSKDFGAYGPFTHSFRLDFTELDTKGEYYIEAGDLRSTNVRINADLYKGSADLILRYMRQQRSFFNPYLQRSEEHTSELQSRFGLVCR